MAQQHHLPLLQLLGRPRALLTSQLLAVRERICGHAELLSTTHLFTFHHLDRSIILMITVMACEMPDRSVDALGVNSAVPLNRDRW